MRISMFLLQLVRKHEEARKGNCYGVGLHTDTADRNWMNKGLRQGDD